MSNIPTGTSDFSISFILTARRSARWIPQVRIPISTSSSVPLFLSTISWAIRLIARSIPILSINILSGIRTVLFIFPPPLRGRGRVGGLQAVSTLPFHPPPPPPPRGGGGGRRRI